MTDIPVKASALKIGFVVFLKSGSPPMTVTGIHGNLIHCTWCGGRYSDIYPDACLSYFPDAEWDAENDWDDGEVN